MLTGRHTECRLLESLVAAARVGQSGVLILTGDPGMGKTALLEYAASVARGMEIHRVTGTEAEHDLPFGGLSQLTGADPVELDRLPGPQEQALAVALNLRHGRPPDRFAVGAATLGLLGRRADAKPLAVLVDDAHLLDHLSLEVMLFAARRLVADPVLLVLAARSGTGTVLTDAGLPVVELGPLGHDDAAELARQVTDGGLAQDSLERLVTVAAGNPLAVLELAGRPDLLETGMPEGPVAVGVAVTRAFLGRVEGLPEDTRTALLVAAASRGDRIVVASACQALDIDPAALVPASDAGLLHLRATTVGFRHPLVRAAVYSAASPGRLRAVHAALAGATPPTDEDGRAWHRAAAVADTDADVAAELESVAARARERAAYDAAASALVRAAELTPTPPDRARRLVAAAEDAWIAGQGPRAAALLDAVGPPDGAHLTARVGRLRGTIAARTGSLRTALDEYAHTAEQVTGPLPDAAVELWAEGVHVAFYAGDVAYLEQAVDALERLAPSVTAERGSILAPLAAGMARVLLGRGGIEEIRGAASQLAASTALRSDPARAIWLVLGPLFLRESTHEQRGLVEQAVIETRRGAVPGTLPHLLLHLALDHAASNRWGRADSEYHEGLHLARESGQETNVAAILAALSMLDARAGREDACRQHAAEAITRCAAHHVVLGQVWALLALGELDLGAGRAQATLPTFDAVREVLAHHGIVDADLDPGPQLAEALVLLGRRAEAAQEADRYQAVAAAKGQPWARARAERGLGLASSDGAADEHFAAALELHAQTLDVFETARTQLAWGASLRRRRRRRDARERLREALATFEDLGAAARAEQAAVELAATGATVQRRGAGPLTSLTPQERQIARLLVSGQTTREAAAQLFLSPKTVEYHLRHVYTKLGVRSRSELAEVFAEE